MHDYDKDNFSYVDYWTAREYEHASELYAISHLLEGHTFSEAADIGGGYGRLAKALCRYATHVTLVEPSVRQRGIASKDAPECLTVRDGSAEESGFSDESLDLVTLVRVMHHIRDPKKSMAEWHRILKPGGLLLIEFANATHAKARVRSALSGTAVSRTPVDIGSSAHGGTTFVNHHPETFLAALSEAGFTVRAVRSVSNFRSPLLKKIVPRSLLLALEHVLQKPLAHLYFGPSIFVLAERL